MSLLGSWHQIVPIRVLSKGSKVSRRRPSYVAYGQNLSVEFLGSTSAPLVGLIRAAATRHVAQQLHATSRDLLMNYVYHQRVLCMVLLPLRNNLGPIFLHDCASVSEPVILKGYCRKVARCPDVVRVTWPTGRTCLSSFLDQHQPHS